MVLSACVDKADNLEKGMSNQSIHAQILKKLVQIRAYDGSVRLDHDGSVQVERLGRQSSVPV